MRKNKTRSNEPKKFYLLGIVLVCSLLFMSVDNCEEMELMDQQYNMEQRAREEQRIALERQEQERLAAASRQNTQTSQSQQASGSGQGTGSQTGTGSTQAPAGGTSGSQGTQAATGSATGSQGTQASTGSATPSQGTQAAASGTQPSAGSTQSQGTQASTGSTTGSQGTQAAAGGTTASQAAAGGSQAGTGGTQAATGTGSTTAQGTVTGSTGASNVTSISGKNWKLTEIRFTDRTVALNRSELPADQADIFTLTIDNERISGRAAPNRYMTAYQAGANNALTIQPIASTMMALIVTDPQRIQEPEYLQYLGKVKSWRINQNKLELTTTDTANQAAIMVFSN